MHQPDHGHQWRAAGEHEAFLRLSRWIDRVYDPFEAETKGLRPGDFRIVATGLVGGGIEEVELVIGEAVTAQAAKEVVQESLDVRLSGVEDVVGLAQPGIDEDRPVAGLEQPVRMGGREL